jgi:hypothetical protein
VTYRVPPHVHARHLHDEVVILDARTDAYLGLNQSGAVVWSVHAAGRSPEAAADELVARVTVEPADASADVSALVAELVARGLLEPVGP